MPVSDDFSTRNFHVEGKEYLYFSGTSYLGIPNNPHFKEKLEEGFRKYGTNYSSSRLSNLDINIFSQTERYLADQYGYESALTVSSGLIAGQLVAKGLLDDHLKFYAPLSHPALTLKQEDFYPGDFQEWSGFILNEVQRFKKKNIILLMNSIDPLYLKPMEFTWIKNLSAENAYTIVIDDSHGLGIIGENGTGISSILPRQANINYVAVASLGKALGIPAGVILSDKITIDQLWHNPLFGGSSPCIPAYLYALSQAQNIYRDTLQSLKQKVAYFATKVENLQLFQMIADYPVFHTSENSLYDFLYKNNVLISSFRYPSQEDELVTRIILNDSHTYQDLDHLIDLLKQYKKLHI